MSLDYRRCNVARMLPPRRSSEFVTRWLLVTVGASLFAWLDGGWLARLAALQPSRVFHGELWRLVTWPLVDLGPLSLVLTCVAIYKFGGELSVRWGDRRLRAFVLQIVLAAGVITCLVAAISGQMFMRRLGGWAISDLLVIAWARQFPERTLVVYGLLGVRGQQLINLTVGVTALFAVAGGFVAHAPELAACAIAALYPAQLLRR
jgi:membrane associated rhomboid family serine protease